MVFRSGCCDLIQANSDLYISNSLGTLRNAHSEILASPPLAATSAMIGNCSPLSDASPAFFCRMPNSDSATLEQVGPTATKASVEAMRRTTEMPSSALQRSSRNSIANLALLPSPSVTPPALLISSAAAFRAASLLTPKTRTTPDLAPKPVILTVRSCADAGAEQASASAPQRDQCGTFHEVLPRLRVCARFSDLRRCATACAIFAGNRYPDRDQALTRLFAGGIPIAAKRIGEGEAMAAKRIGRQPSRRSAPCAPKSPSRSGRRDRRRGRQGRVATACSPACNRTRRISRR